MIRLRATRLRRDKSAYIELRGYGVMWQDLQN
jgi:hypothetical protein